MSLRRVLRSLLLGEEKAEEAAPSPPLEAKDTFFSSDDTEVLPSLVESGPAELVSSEATDHSEAMAYLGRLRAKMEKIAKDFAEGQLSQPQFEKLYAHYQAERANIELLMQTFPDGDEWKSAVTDGHSIAIRRRYQAIVIAYAIYDNEASLPLYTFGDFQMESELVVGMLSSFRSASNEIFGAGLRKTEVEDGKVLYFLPGQYTTLLALYSSEPPSTQLRILEEVHRHFEIANIEALQRGGAQPSQLVFPHRPVLE
jgi:hypothetical protein